MASHSGTWIYGVDRFVDVFFVFDIVLNFVTGYAHKGNSKVVLDPKKIARQYARSWFVPDLIASFPFDIIAAGTSNSEAYRSTKFVRILKLLRLVKLFRIMRLNRILHRLERKMSIKYGIWQVMKFAVVVLCLAHWLACAWYLSFVLQDHGAHGVTWVELLAQSQARARPRRLPFQTSLSFLFTLPLAEGASLLRRFARSTDGRSFVSIRKITQDSERLDEQGRSTRYATCVYWAITTMTTIGYGDIVPSNRDERMMTIFAQLAGSCVFLYGLTQVTSLIANINGADVEFQKLMDQANEYFEFRNIPNPLRAKVREFFHYKRATSLFHAEDKLLGHLSDSMRMEVQLWSMRNVLNTIDFFRDADEQFVKCIIGKLIRRVYSPRETVMKQGEIGDEMFFIVHGEVEGAASALLYTDWFPYDRVRVVNAIPLAS